jgi:capsular polysaccharide biosynthesis protein
VSFREILLSLRRQWVSVLLGLVLTTAACFAAAAAVPPTYRATASVVLLPSEQTLPDEEVNPFLFLGGTNPMRDVLTRSVMADAVYARLMDDTVDTTYVVYPDATAAPIIVAVADGPTRAQTIRTLEAVLEQVDRSLVEIQDRQGVPAAAQVVSQQLSVQTEADLVRSATLRAVVAVAVLGLCGTILGAVWVDALRRSRRAGKDEDGAALDQEPLVEAEEDTPVQAEKDTPVDAEEPDPPQWSPEESPEVARPASPGRPSPHPVSHAKAVPQHIGTR